MDEKEIKGGRWEQETPGIEKDRERERERDRWGEQGRIE